jgi:hypothetical protein
MTNNLSNTQRRLRNEMARQRARNNNASLSGNLNFLNKGRNIAFHVGNQSNGTPIYRAEDSHVLARWFMRSVIHPFTRKPVPKRERVEIFKRALETRTLANASDRFTPGEIATMKRMIAGSPKNERLSREELVQARMRGRNSVRRTLQFNNVA